MQGHCYALDTTTGKHIWHNQLSGMGSGNCTLAMDAKCSKLFLGQEGRVMALDANCGGTLWKQGLSRTGYDVVTLCYSELPGLKVPSAPETLTLTLPSLCPHRCRTRISSSRHLEGEFSLIAPLMVSKGGRPTSRPPSSATSHWLPAHLRAVAVHPAFVVMHTALL